MVFPALIVVGFVAFGGESWLLFFGGAFLVFALWAAAAMFLPATPLDRREFKVDL